MSVVQMIRCFKNETAKEKMKSSACFSLKRGVKRHAEIFKNVKDHFEDVFLHVANARGNKFLLHKRRSS